MAVTNMAASVLSRLKNQAKEERLPFQMILAHIAGERNESSFGIISFILKSKVDLFIVTGNIGES